MEEKGNNLNTLIKLRNELKRFYWGVSVKGNYKNSEVSVVRLDNDHGFCSYGWEDHKKIIILSPNCLDREEHLRKDIAHKHWFKLIKCAIIMRDSLNDLSNNDNKKEIEAIQNEINRLSDSKEKYEFLIIKNMEDLLLESKRI